jgi:WD40 repeat protein
MKVNIARAFILISLAFLCVFYQKRAFSQSSSPINTLAWKSDDELLATGTMEGTVEIWDAESGGLITSLQISEEAQIIVSISWQSPSGDLLAIGLPSGEVQIWDVTTERQISSFRAMDLGTQVVWQPNYDAIAVSGRVNPPPGSSYEANLWDPLTGQLLQSIGGSSLGIADISWNSDGTLLAIAGVNGTADIWNLSGDFTRIFDDSDIPVRSIDWGPDDQSLVIAAGNSVEDGTVQIMSISGETQRIFDEFVSDVAWNPVNNTIALNGPRGWVLIDIETGDHIAELSSNEDEFFIEGTFEIAWNNAGDRFAVGNVSLEPQIYLFETQE